MRNKLLNIEKRRLRNTSSMQSWGSLIVASREEELNRDPKLRNISNQSMHEPTSPEPQQVTPEISPDFFNGITLYLKIADPVTASVAENALTNSGASVIREMPFLADYVISDKPMAITRPSYTNSRLSSFINSTNKDEGIPRVILLQQISWIFNKNIDYKEELKEANPTMVVADSICWHAPNYKEMSKIPELHFGEVPRWYLLSPFDQIPEQIESLVPHIKRLTAVQAKAAGPMKDGYCEFCKTKIGQDPNAHRAGVYHKSFIRDNIWKDFDQISAALNKNFLSK